MTLKGIAITLLVGSTILASCAAEDACPVTASKPEYYFKKKVKFKYNKKRKPTPSLIHITRVNYRPGSGN
jgi:hypothetical protein